MSWDKSDGASYSTKIVANIWSHGDQPLDHDSVQTVLVSVFRVEQTTPEVTLLNASDEHFANDPIEFVLFHAISFMFVNEASNEVNYNEFHRKISWIVEESARLGATNGTNSLCCDSDNCDKEGLGWKVVPRGLDLSLYEDDKPGPFSYYCWYFGASCSALPCNESLQKMQSIKGAAETKQNELNSLLTKANEDLYAEQQKVEEITAQINSSKRELILQQQKVEDMNTSNEAMEQ